MAYVMASKFAHLLLLMMPATIHLARRTTLDRIQQVLNEKETQMVDDLVDDNVRALSQGIHAEMFADHAHPLVDVPPAVGSILTVFMTVGQMRSLASNVALWKEAGNLKMSLLSNDLMRNLDSLRKIHDTLVSKLGVEPKEWNAICEQCTEKEKSSGTYLTFSNSFNTSVAEVGRDKCLARMHAAINLMRIGLVKLDHEADRLIQKLKMTRFEHESVFEDFGDRGCDDDCEGCITPAVEAAQAQMVIALDRAAFHDPGSTDPSRACRELPPAMSIDQVQKECKAMCLKMHGCKGVTLYDGPLHGFRASGWRDRIETGDNVRLRRASKFLNMQCRNMEIIVADDDGKPCAVDRTKLRCVNGANLGCWPTAELVLLKKSSEVVTIRNRCCFRASVENTYTQESTTCFKRSEDDRLTPLDTEGLLDWLRSRSASNSTGFEGALETAASNIEAGSLNGLALGSMGSLKLAQYLGISNPGYLKIFMCMIQAMKADDNSDKCLEPQFLNWFAKAYSIVDSTLFWAARMDFSKGSTWINYALAKVADASSSFLKQYNWIGAASIVSHSKNFALLAANISTVPKVLMSLAGQLSLGSEMNPYVLASASLYLVNKAASRAWDQCWVVERWLSRTDLTEEGKIDAVVNSALQGASLDDFHDPCLEDKDFDCDS